MTLIDVAENHWSLQAACRGRWDLFDAIDDDERTDSYVDKDRAFAICGTCKVKPECKADNYNEKTGIWFGEVLSK